MQEVKNSYWKYLWCLIRLHHPKKESHWDMVGDPRYNGWNVYSCKCSGEWREQYRSLDAK
jgi:hypothetical protein